MLFGDGLHFIDEVIIKDRTSIDFWPKKIGARIGTRHTAILLLSDQVVDAT